MALARQTQLALQTIVQAAAQFNQGGLLACQAQVGLLLLQAVLQPGEYLQPLRQIIIQRHFQPLPLRLYLPHQLQLIPADQFRCCRRRRRTQISDKIGNGDVGLMADRADYR